MELPHHQTLGRHITKVIVMAIDMAKTNRCDVTFKFNGIDMKVSPGSSPGDQYRIWRYECELMRLR